MGVPQKPYEGLHIIFYISEEAHTNERFIFCDGHQPYAFKGRGVDLEVKGVHYYRDASRVTYVLGSPPSRGGDLELEGGVNVS